jgi:hypothetical protein
MTEGERLAYITGLAGIYRTTENDFEKNRIIDAMNLAGGLIGMFFPYGASREAMLQTILSRTDLVWASPPVVFMPTPPAPVVQCTCQHPQPVLEFPAGKKFWDIISEDYDP